ncbi:hypothetical protein [Amycolatopsis saalfeldensis]|uniref:Uncharacterized protein n=1 Tax=Amycolatopsis saalfeldensis TaxID=394193 RepID=A0A1H8Y0T5_9PSEU|nr:hypothetical protein [Amycolatopsis saalfeldensis]SEP45910.1 hypothetical protein SAMN04489732_110140 [Amycolatopsis saalfeldensis]
MKSVIWWSIGLLFGLGLMAIGLFGTMSDSDIVLCGSETMQPGETCETTTYGQKSSETYEEKLQESKDDKASFEGGGRWVTFGIGAGIGALCGWRLVVAIRRKARQGSGTAAAAVEFGQGSGAVGPTVAPGQQPGFGPPPGYPQQFPQQFPQQQGYPAAQNHQPGYQQQGFPPPQGFQQPPPPGYQNGPYQQ